MSLHLVKLCVGAESLDDQRAWSEKRLADMEAAGTALAQVPGVTLCYQRETVPGVWPYGLFSMIHARSRPEAMAVLECAKTLPQLSGVAHQVLFSTRCFKQTGAQIAGTSDKAA